MLSAEELAHGDWCDGVRALGSYWQRTDDADLQSQLVRYFKGPGPRPLGRPCMVAIVRAYGAMLADAARDCRPQMLVRVIASGETRPDPQRPHSMLARVVSDALGIPDFSHLFFRTEPRKPMRMVDRLAGPQVLQQRINYVLQDLFVSPVRLGGIVLVLDDIYNLGATARVYAAALKRLCGAERVYSVNLAAARFAGGKDGWGYLTLDTDRFAADARKHLGSHDPADALDDVWVQRGAAEFHASSECSKLAGQGHRSFRFLACRDRVPCAACAAPAAHGTVRSWLLNRSQP